MICISIGNIEQLEALKGYRHDMVELRYDLIKKSPSELMPLVEYGTKVIATCRPGNLTSEHRMQILKESIDRGAAYIDLEIESDTTYINELISYAKEHATEVIISWHALNRTPTKEEIEEKLHECYKKGADVAKIASMVHDEKDIANLLSLYALKGRKVVLGMGEKGKISRIAASYLGAEFTFVSLDAGKETAPGQLTMNEFAALKKILEPK